MTTLNPIQAKISAGMSPLVAFLSEHTCGEACWSAREDICHCSCGGKNHGCMRDADGVRPVRTAKIDGYRYELRAVGYREVATDAEAINRAAGYREVVTVTPTLVYHYTWSETDPGAPARLKFATKDQVTRWPELSAYRGEDMTWNRPYLLWTRVSA